MILRRAAWHDCDALRRQTLPRLKEADARPSNWYRLDAFDSLRRGSLYVHAQTQSRSKQQANAKTLAERLGYSRDAKLIIVHADDVGVTHSVNAATVTALNTGLVNSASIMVPCPWFPEIADYAKAHQDVDFGLHLTLTAERVYYRWGPVAPRDKVPSLVDENGYFWHDWSPTTHIDPKDVEIELRAQIERALAMGVRPTHLDSHQYRLIMTNKELFEVFVRLAHEYRIAVFCDARLVRAISVSGAEPRAE